VCFFFLKKKDEVNDTLYFNDLDSYAYAMLRASIATPSETAAAAETLRALKLPAADLVAEDFL